MVESGNKSPLIVLEVMALIIFTIVTYWGALKLIFTFGYGPFPVIFLIVVAACDVIYISTIKFWSLKNIHIKIIVALLLLACSAALVTIFCFVTVIVPS